MIILNIFLTIFKDLKCSSLNGNNTLKSLIAGGNTLVIIAEWDFLGFSKGVPSLGSTSILSSSSSSLDELKLVDVWKDVSADIGTCYIYILYKYYIYNYITPLHKYCFFVFCFYSSYIYMYLCMRNWCLILLLSYHPNLVPAGLISLHTLSFF